VNLYTSDLHFGHKNVIQFDHRPFSNVEEMDAFIMQCWNKRVQPDDIVYILGDFCHRSEKEPSWYLKRLKGHKILIVGNHDGKLLKNQVALSYFDRVEDMMLKMERIIFVCAIIQLLSGMVIFVNHGMSMDIFIIRRKKRMIL